MTFSLNKNGLLQNNSGVTIRLTEAAIVYSEGMHNITFALEAGVSDSGNDQLIIVHWPASLQSAKDISIEKIVNNIKEAISVLNIGVLFSPVF